MTAWFDLMAGVPQIAANLLQRTSRQPWAKNGLVHRDYGPTTRSTLGTRILIAGGIAGRARKLIASLAAAPTEFVGNVAALDAD
jgi:hypothetical protein